MDIKTLVSDCFRYTYKYIFDELRKMLKNHRFGEKPDPGQILSGE